jgi:acyl-CoA reductase-like NAD-dependent aldehyde dehydrogenase
MCREWYGPDPQKSPDLCRIVNNRHFTRLARLLSTTKGRVEVGGQTDEADLYMAPTLLTGVLPEEPIMQEEIFGPLFPILTVRSRQEAVDFINSRDKPLSLYVFSTDKVTPGQRAKPQ